MRRKRRVKYINVMELNKRVSFDALPASKTGSDDSDVNLPPYLKTVSSL